MGQCCASVRYDDKLETIVRKYENELGWPSTQFDVFSKQIDIHSADGIVHQVRVPMLAHSLGIKLKGDMIPGARAIFDYIQSEDKGWICRRLAALGALTCQGNVTSKASYLLLTYGTERRLVTRENMVEMIADCVHIALSLIPTGAQEYMLINATPEIAERVSRYCNLLKHAVEDLCVFLLAETFNDGRSFIMAERFTEKLQSSNLKCLCDASLLRRLGARLVKQDRDLVPDETCDKSTVQNSSGSGDG